jgi:hypothetical protein
LPFMAFEFDHLIGMHSVRWLVMECAGVETHYGGPQALKPRRDVAYFVDPETAEIDAREFADYKNRTVQAEQNGDPFLAKALNGDHPAKHVAYAWDHTIYSQYIQWATLEWSGDHAVLAPRQDVAYFVDLETAETDAKAFCFIRDQRVKVGSLR